MYTVTKSYNKATGLAAYLLLNEEAQTISSAANSWNSVSMNYAEIARYQPQVHVYPLEHALIRMTLADTGQVSCKN
jgi:hypothetical protein